MKENAIEEQKMTKMSIAGQDIPVMAIVTTVIALSVLFGTVFIMSKAWKAGQK